MKNKYKLSGGSIFWLFALAVIVAVGVYLAKDTGTEQAVQTFGGGYTAPNRSFTDLFYR